MDNLLVYTTGKYNEDFMERILRVFSKNGFYIYGLFENPPDNAEKTSDLYDDYTVLTSYNLDGSLSKYRESGCRMVLVNNDVSYKYFSKILNDFNIISLVTDCRSLNWKNILKTGVFFLPYKIFDYVRSFSFPEKSKNRMCYAENPMKTLKESDMIVSSSGIIADKLAKKNIDRKNIELVPLFSDNDQKYHRPEKKEKISLYIPDVFGNISVIKIMMDFVSENADRFELIIDDRAGGGLELRNYLSYLPAQGGITFYDNSKSKSDYLRYTDLVIVPDREGCRYLLSVVDALSFGRGIISFNSPLITEIAPEQECSIIMRGDLRDSFRTIMNTIYKDRSGIEYLGSNCYRRFTEKFTSDIFVQAMKKCITELNT